MWEEEDSRLCKRDENIQVFLTYETILGAVMGLTSATTYMTLTETLVENRVYMAVTG